MSLPYPPAPAGSHAWCSEPDCDWTDNSPECVSNAQAHSEGLQHLVHAYSPDDAALEARKG